VVFSYTAQECIDQDTIDLVESNSSLTTPIRVLAYENSELVIYAVDECLGAYFQLQTIPVDNYYNTTFFSNDSVMYINTDQWLSGLIALSTHGDILDTLLLSLPVPYEWVEYDSPNYYFINSPADVVFTSSEPLPNTNLQNRGTSLVIHLSDLTHVSVHNNHIIGINSTGKMVDNNLDNMTHTIETIPVMHPTDIEITDNWIRAVTDSHFISKFSRSTSAIHQVYRLPTTDSIVSTLFLNK